MNKPISTIFVKVKVDMLGLIVHDSLNITSVNFKHKKLHTITAPKVNSRLLAYHGRLPCWRSYKILEKHTNKEVSSWCPSFCCFALSLYLAQWGTFSYQHSHKRILPTVVLEKTIKTWRYLQTRLSGNSNLRIEFCSSQWNIVPPYNIKPLVYFAVLKREKNMPQY